MPEQQHLQQRKKNKKKESEIEINIEVKRNQLFIKKTITKRE
jgi:hypothetical protein